MASITPSFLFIVSRKDPAGLLMAEYLCDLHSCNKVSKDVVQFEDCDWYLAYIDNDIIYSDEVDKQLGMSPKTIIFLSRHSSRSGSPTLSVHVTGNPTGEAEYGGKPYSLAISHPILMRSTLVYMSQIARERGLQYHVSLEVTHHGPSEISSPSFFVEVGSSIEQWKDKKAIQAAVDSVLKAIKSPLEGIPAVGFGGPHYAPTFTRYALEKGYAFGHILSKHVLGNTGFDIIMDAFKKTSNTKTAVFNWKGIPGGIRRQLYEELTKKGFEVVKA
jgi:D-aminoacyl-tRNA deacylase